MSGLRAYISSAVVGCKKDHPLPAATLIGIAVVEEIGLVSQAWIIGTMNSCSSMLLLLLLLLLLAAGYWMVSWRLTAAY